MLNLLNFCVVIQELGKLFEKEIATEIVLNSIWQLFENCNLLNETEQLMHLVQRGVCPDPK